MLFFKILDGVNFLIFRKNIILKVNNNNKKISFVLGWGYKLLLSLIYFFFICKIFFKDKISYNLNKKYNIGIYI